MNKFKFLFFFVTTILIPAQVTAVGYSSIVNNERHFVIVTASYNNKEWYQRNLDSIFNQNYRNYHVIYVTDCPTDGTDELVANYVQEKNLSNYITLIQNTTRKKALANLYYAIHLCDSRSIIVIVDGDDFLAHENVLAHLNKVYANNNVWLTYGQFREWPSGAIGFCAPMPSRVVKNNTFRTHDNAPSHLRTFYAGLFKKIRIEDLMHDGNFFEMTYDLAIMFPMMEMARHHFEFIPEVLLDYNTTNPISDHRVDKSLQRKLDLAIRNRRTYPAINSPFKGPYPIR